MSQEEIQEVILKVEKLSKSFPGVLANDKVSFDVRKGEIHCLLGENGAGKSTLAECLYGTYHPDSGKIFFQGEEIHLNSHLDAIKLGIGMVHQHFQLVAPMTVMENIVAGTDHKGIGINIGPATEKVLKICENYGIELPLDTIISRLPVGQQQWVEILKALYVGADLLLLDEPTLGLGPKLCQEMAATIKWMAEGGLSLILVEQNARLALNLAHRGYVLDIGKIALEGKAEELKNNALVKEAYLGA